LKQSGLREARQRVNAIQHHIDNTSDADTNKQLKNNLDLARQLTELTSNYYDGQSHVTSADEEISDTDKAIRLVERIVAAGRADGELGDILRRFRSGLVSQSQITVEIEKLQDQQIQLQLDTIVWEDQLDAVTMGQDTPLGEFEILENRRDILSSLVSIAARFETNLANRYVKLETLQEKTRSLSRALDGRLLWLPTNRRFDVSWIQQTLISLRSFFSLPDWEQTLHELFQNSSSRTLVASILIIMALCIVLLKRRIKARLSDFSTRLHKVGQDSQLLTPWALVITFLSIFALPLAFWAVAYALADSEAVFPRAISAAFRDTASLCMILGFFTTLAAPGGIVEAHFKWSSVPRQILYSNLKWLTVLMVPATFLFTYAVSVNDTNSQYGLGRMTFIFVSAILVFAGFRILRPGGEVLERMFGHLRFRFVGYLVFIIFAGLPLVLAVLTLSNSCSLRFGRLSPATSSLFSLASWAAAMRRSIACRLAVRRAETSYALSSMP
jgi:small-conductance mechanosensitive channel